MNTHTLTAKEVKDLIDNKPVTLADVVKAIREVAKLTGKTRAAQGTVNSRMVSYLEISSKVASLDIALGFEQEFVIIKTSIKYEEMTEDEKGSFRASCSYIRSQFGWQSNTASKPVALILTPEEKKASEEKAVHDAKEAKEALASRAAAAEKASKELQEKTVKLLAENNALAAAAAQLPATKAVETKGPDQHPVGAKITLEEVKANNSSLPQCMAKITAMAFQVLTTDEQKTLQELFAKLTVIDDLKKTGQRIKANNVKL